MKTVNESVAAARQYVADHDDDDEMTSADLRDCFGALYGREPDADDIRIGLWSLCCAAV